MLNINSSRVKKWRQVTKQRMINSLGGRCGICGYNKCPESLEFHHLDPTQKEFGFGQSRANIKSWDKLVVELRKCVLLCANCHRECHAGLISNHLVESLPRFNEEYATYNIYPNKALDNCPICNKLKPINRVTCSRICAGKKPKKVDWLKVDLAQLLLDYKNYEQMGIALGVTGAAVKRQFKKLNMV